MCGEDGLAASSLWRRRVSRWPGAGGPVVTPDFYGNNQAFFFILVKSDFLAQDDDAPCGSTSVVVAASHKNIETPRKQHVPMARTIGSNGARTAEAIRQAGVRLIYRHGYEATSLRQLAAEVGLQSGSLYKYFDNKQSLLFDIVREHMGDLLEKAEADLAGIADPAARLKAFVGFHLRYHMTRMAHVFIANMEIRSLDEPRRAEVVGLRRRYEGLLEAILHDGAKAGVFAVAEPRVVTYAIISMLTGICMWYRPDGPLDQDQLVAIHTGLVLDGVTGRAAGAFAAAPPPAPALRRRARG